MITILTMSNRKLASIFFIVGVLLIVILVLLFLFINHKNSKKTKELKSLIINGITLDLEIKTLMTIVEQIWRIEKKSTQQGVVIDPTVIRDFDRLKKELYKFGFEYNDYTGRKYIGINVDVLEARTATNIKEPIIYETVKPEILVNGNRVQKSLVVIAQPTKANSFKIIFQSNDGKFIPEIIKEEGTIIEELPIPIRENHNFLYWINSSNQERISVPFVLKENLMLYPEWEEIVIKAEIPPKNKNFETDSSVYEDYINQMKNE